MYALSGYVNEDVIVTDENISSFNGRKVVITILDIERDAQLESVSSIENKKNAARNLAGMWKDHNNEVTVEETVRSLRKGRNFDI